MYHNTHRCERQSHVMVYIYCHWNFDKMFYQKIIGSDLSSTPVYFPFCHYRENCIACVCRYFNCNFWKCSFSSKHCFFTWRRENKLHIFQNNPEKHGFTVYMYRAWIYCGSCHKLNVGTLLLLNQTFDSYFVKYLILYLLK